MGAISRINKGLANPPLIFKVNSIIVGGEWAVVEMQAVDAKAKAGWDFDNHYCWVCRFQKVSFKLTMSKRGYAYQHSVFM